MATRKTNVKAGVKFSNNYRTMMKMFPRLPVETQGIFLSAVKRDALRYMRNFKQGILLNTFGLDALEDGTIVRKRREGMSNPDFPLYGMGDERERDSYMNMMRIKPIREGYRVYPSKDLHHSERIELNRLFNVHEKGMIITVGKGKKKRLIRIPARPAGLKAFRQAMRQRKTRETADLLKIAIVLYLKTKQKSVLRKLEDHFLKGLEEYEVSD